MQLERSPIVRQWLQQFDSENQKKARYFFRRLKFITNNELMIGLEKVVEKQAASYGRVALYPVKKNPQGRVRRDGESARDQYDSSAIIGRFIENMQRKDPKRYIANPKARSLKSEKIKKIIFIDDGIYSGNRVLKCWKSQVSKTIKSWLSYGVCEIAFVSYYGENDGKSHILKNIDHLPETSVDFYITSELAVYPREWDFEDDSLISGFRGGMSLVVFEHGVSNTLPSFFWCDKVVKNPLFPRQSVPAEFFNFLKSSDHERNRIIEVLADKELIKDALVLETLDQEQMLDLYRQVILAMISSGYSNRRVAAILCVPQQHISSLIEAYTVRGYMMPDGTLAEKGKSLIGANRTAIISQIMKKQQLGPYIPKQFKGAKINV